VRFPVRFIALLYFSPCACVGVDLVHTKEMQTQGQTQAQGNAKFSVSVSVYLLVLALVLTCTCAWHEVKVVRTSLLSVHTAKTEGQYSTVRPEQAQLLSCFLHGIRILSLIVTCTSGGLHLKGVRRDVVVMTRAAQTKANYTSSSNTFIECETFQN